MAPRALVVIGGTTASGKSALAIRVAEAVSGIVVNADSQQLFFDLPTLTARPTSADEAIVPHRLYGLLDPWTQPSAGRWLDLVAGLLSADDDRPLVLCGGTGLYLKALFEGIAATPPVPPEARAALAEETAAIATPALHARLERIDPTMAGRLRPSDRQRILRALEVVTVTGRSLAEWQSMPVQPLPLPDRIVGVGLVPEPSRLAVRIAARLDAMLAEGALLEVEALYRRLGSFVDLPIAKVHGARELLAVVLGTASLDAAREPIAAQVRQYAKRQRTFLRHQLPMIRPVPLTADDPDAADLLADLISRSRS